MQNILSKLFHRSMSLGVWIALIPILVTPLGALQAAQVFSYQGFLQDSLGNPVPDSAYTLGFEIYADSTGVGSLWSETATVRSDGGIFLHLLGSVNILPDSMFQEFDELYLEILIDGEAAQPRSRLGAVPFAFSAANLKVRDMNDSLAITTEGDRHRLSIRDTSGIEVVAFSGIDSADLSVVLPDSAINSLEILDEPGISAAINVNQVALFTGEMTDLVTVDITIPAEGYVVLHGKCYLLLNGTTGPNNAFIQIDDEEGGPSEFPYYTIAGLGGYVNTATSYFPIYVTRIYFDTAGTYTFRMEGRASFPPPAEARTWDHVLTAIYYSTAYDAVKSLAASPAGYPGAVPVQVMNRPDKAENGLYYEVDLRKLEKAKETVQPQKK